MLQLLFFVLQSTKTSPPLCTSKCQQECCNGGGGEKWGRQQLTPSSLSEMEIALWDREESIFYCQSFQFCWFQLNP